MSQAQDFQAQSQAARAQAPANAQAPSNGQPQDAKPKAFNLILEGIGYLNRVRWVPVKKGPSYLCCTINAMMGVENEIEYVAIDCRVVGRQAIAVVEQLTDDVNAKAKVIVGFRASDPMPDFYTFEDAKTKEQVERRGFKARLLQITLAKVNGQRVDIPLVERPSEGDRAASGAAATGAAGERFNDDGVGSACEGEAHVPA